MAISRLGPFLAQENYNIYLSRVITELNRVKFLTRGAISRPPFFYTLNRIITIIRR